MLGVVTRFKPQADISLKYKSHRSRGSKEHFANKLPVTHSHGHGQSSICDILIERSCYWNVPMMAMLLTIAMKVFAVKSAWSLTGATP